MIINLEIHVLIYRNLLFNAIIFIYIIYFHSKPFSTDVYSL